MKQHNTSNYRSVLRIHPQVSKEADAIYFKMKLIPSFELMQQGAHHFTRNYLSMQRRTLKRWILLQS